jgi:hypothetical protein
MSSYLRTIQRRAARKASNYEAPPQPTRTFVDGSYETLRPTKGWLRLSIARLWAQQRLAQMLDHVLPERTRKPRKVWREPGPDVPYAETRQQRRARERSVKKCPSA